MATFLTAVPAFIFALGTIVFIHELGHHLMAKLFGVRVLTFSLGFGRRLAGFHFRGTDYRLSLIPLGGYVRMGGELPEERTTDPSEFLNKPRWQRILVYLAGPAMNVVLSVTLIAAVFMIGIPMQALQEIPAIVGMVEEDSAGEEAGLLPGDRLVSLAGQEVERWQDAAFILATSVERPVAIEVERDGVRLEKVITPTKAERYEYGETGLYPQVLLRLVEIFDGLPAAEAGFEAGDELLRIDGRTIEKPDDFVLPIQQHPGRAVTIEVLRRGQLLAFTVVPRERDGEGWIGVQLGYYRQLGLGEALVESVRYNIDIVDKTLQILGKLFTNEIAPKSALSGPIEIAAWSGRAAQRGFMDLLYMMGFLSISIGLMNLLPIPVLDGGHITILLIESAMRRDLSMVLKERVTQVGFMMLMTLMAIVIFFDLAKNLPGLIPGS